MPITADCVPAMRYISCQQGLAAQPDEDRAAEAVGSRSRGQRTTSGHLVAVPSCAKNGRGANYWAVGGRPLSRHPAVWMSDGSNDPDVDETATMTATRRWGLSRP